MDNQVTGDVGVIVVAAGSGTRFGRPKQFEEIDGTPLVGRVVSTFANVKDVCCIVVVTRDEDVDVMKSILQQPTVSVVGGGQTRQESMSKGLEVLRKHSAIEIVLVHDVARALIDRTTIERLIAEIRKCGSAIVGIPVIDSMKRVIEGEIVETIPRQDLWRAQTPQGAKLPLLIAAIEQARLAKYDAKDESELLERIGEKPRIVAGSETNFKITYPDDLARARVLHHAANQSE